MLEVPHNPHILLGMNQELLHLTPTQLRVI